LSSLFKHWDGPIENLVSLLIVAMQPTLAIHLLVAMQRNKTGVVSVSMYSTTVA
jgi:hypothetical protein